MAVVNDNYSGRSGSSVIVAKQTQTEAGSEELMDAELMLRLSVGRVHIDESELYMMREALDEMHSEYYSSAKGGKQRQELTNTNYNPEAPLSFLTALARTIQEIEEAQPEPGFREVFMELLDRNLEGAIMGDSVNGMDTRKDVEVIRETLGALLISGDITDAVDSQSDA